MKSKAKDKTSLGMKPNIEAVLCYGLGWITGLVFWALEKENKFVRFHAIQSTLTFGILTIAFLLIFWISPLLLSVGLGLIAGISLALWILMMVRAYRGEKYKLPWVGGFAQRHA